MVKGVWEKLVARYYPNTQTEQQNTCYTKSFLVDGLGILWVSVNQHVVGWLEGLWYPQPTRVQILVLAFIPGFISGFPAMRIQWEETFPSTTRCLR